MAGAAVAIDELVVYNAPQPDELLFGREPGEIIMLQGRQEDAQGEVLGILPRRGERPCVGQNGRRVPVVERAIGAMGQLVFSLFLHNPLPRKKLSLRYFCSPLHIETRKSPKCDGTLTEQWMLSLKGEARCSP